MPRWQVTFIFDIPGHSFTESYFTNDQSTNPDVPYVRALRVAKVRMGVAGGECLMAAIRISNADDPGRVGKTYHEPIIGDKNYQCSASNVAFNCQLFTADSQFSKIIQVRGCPDVWEHAGGAIDKEDPTLKSRFQAFFNALVQEGFGWRSIVSQQTFDVTTYATDPFGRVKITVKQSTAPVGATGLKKAVRITGVNGGHSRINGMQVVAITDDKEFTTVKPLAVGAFNFPGKLLVPSYTVRVAASGLLQRLGKRQAGAPLLRSRGRGPAKART
jgi:hypothetical protein